MKILADATYISRPYAANPSVSIKRSQSSGQLKQQICVTECTLKYPLAKYGVMMLMMLIAFRILSLGTVVSIA